MQWFGKAIGAIVGFAAGGPIGSVLGALLGHRVDESGVLGGAARARSAQISRLFFEVTFEVMGRVAKIDGRVSEDEVRTARRIMDGMRLSREQVRDAIDCFTRGKVSSYPLTQRLESLREQIGGRDVLARAFMQIQLQSAIGAGPIGAEKRQLLWRIASALGVDRAELAQIEELLRSYERRGGAPPPADATTLADAYRVLGVTPQTSDDEVKTAYRRLMNQHHPDKLVARGLPKSMAGVADQKTREIRAAYERVRSQRGFR